jgi:hypothetical protein
MRGLLRLRLEQADEVEGVIASTLKARRTAKERCETALAHDLQEILLGPSGIAFRDGPGGGVVDTTQLRQNRRARAAALARIDQEFRKRLEPELLPKVARAPTPRAGVTR